MNLGQIETAVYDQLGVDATSPQPELQRRVRHNINTVQRELMTKKGIGSRLRKVILAASTQAGIPTMTLPQAMVSFRIVRDLTNNRTLDQVSLEWIRAADPGNTSSTSTPWAYALMGFAAPVAADPAAATALKAISDSASDGLGTAVSVEGVTSNGQYRKASISMNGTTQVSLDSSVAWTNLSKFYLSSPAAGNVSLKDSSGNVLAVIAQGRQFARYTRILLYSTPSTVLSLTFDGELHIEDMLNAADEPYVPEDFHDIFELGALSKEYSKQDKGGQYGTLLSAYRKRTAELRVWLGRPTGLAWWSERNRHFSQLGPWFSAGT